MSSDSLSSPSLQARAADPVPDTTGSTKALRNLYFVRFGFAIIWAILLMLIATRINPAAIALIVIYPLFDVAAAIIDYRSSGSSRPKAPLYINMALSLLTAIGLAIAVGSGVPNVLRVWGAWAITAGIVQLIVAILRWRLGGQLAMILSGGISVLAGGSFIAMAGGPGAALTGVGGYAILGGIFFLISAIRLHVVIPKAVE
ncbi:MULTISPECIES: hypothetical protein [unclassified Brachybacterium]|uniref:hypothetical protein n=1 Tax=unclassified Brachybacterium TaxID=2623841 RepID=UPI0036218426